MLNKIFFSILIIFIFSDITFGATTLNYTTGGSPFKSECPSEPGTDMGAGPRTKFGVPAANQTNSPLSSSISCNTNYYYTAGDYTKPISPTSGITNCGAGEIVVGINGTTSITCRKFDNTPPSLSDIGDTTPSNGANLLASNSYNFSIGVNDGGQAPITVRKVFFEDYNSANTYLPTSSEYYPGGKNENISDVDNSRASGGFRTYSLRLSKICDTAGNCLGSDISTSNLKTYSYNVFANTIGANIGTKSVTTNDLTSTSNISDGTPKRLKITLKDIYGNEIVPASAINRTIDLKFDASNTMYLNQYTRTGNSSVFVTSANGSDYTNKIALGNNITQLNSQNSNDGVYEYNFKVYTPTYNQNNGPVSDTSANLRFNSINFDINSSMSSPVGVNPQNQNVTLSSFDSKFSPLYYTQFTGEISDNGFIEGGQQNSEISISKNGSKSTTNNKLQLSYGGVDSGKFNMYAGTGILSLISAIDDIKNTIPVFPSTNNNILTKLVQKSGVVGKISNIFLASHISYDIDGLRVTYNSDIVGKDSYYGVDKTLANQSSLKVLGNIRSKSANSLTTNQFPSDVRIVGESEKFTVKSKVVENSYVFTKNLTGNSTNLATITDVDSPNIGTIAGNVIYFGSHNNAIAKTYIIGDGSNIGVSTSKTIVAIGGNIYIKSNLYYSNKKTGMLGIIALKDKNGNGGNIYIDPSVTNIVGVLFAEKSVLSYDGVNEIDGSTEITKLKNQLHIYGSLFSENSIGGSRLATPKCPYYLTSGCTIDVAQKYDLNYLRRFYLIPDGIYKKPAYGGKGIGGGIYSGNGNYTGGNNSFARNITNTTQLYSSNSVVIEYNSNVQLNPPPLFK